MRQLLSAAEGDGRVRFAVTFDDDDPAHVRLALPVLESLGICATFFLSGRVLHELEPYWWKILEKTVAGYGLDHVCRSIGVASAESPAELARTIEATPNLAERLHDLPVEGELPQLDIEGIRLLAGAGMDIGFHTVHHPVLSAIPDAELDFALRFGRDDLASASGRPIDLLAYPHGKADLRVARRAEASGFTAAFAGGGRPVDSSVDRFLLGRWEPGPLQPDVLVASTILRLHRSTAVPRE